MENFNNENLKSENIRLKNENDFLKSKQKNRKEFNNKIGKKIKRIVANLIFGSNLNESIKTFILDLKEDKAINNNSLADLIASFTRRMIRVSFISFLIAIIPLTLSIIQTTSLLKQNKYIKQQYYIDENNKNNTISLLINDLINDIEKELKEKNNLERELSNELIDRIISITYYLKPNYTFYQTKKLLKSDERGFILYSLTRYKLSNKSFRKIIENATFSHSNLSGLELKNVDLSNALLSGSFFSGTKLTNCSFKDAFLHKSVFSHSLIINSIFNNARLDYSTLDNTIFKSCDLRHLILRHAIIKNIDLVAFSNKQPIKQNLSNTDMQNPYLDNWFYRAKKNVSTSIDINNRNDFKVNIKVNKETKVSTLRFINSHNWVDKNWIKRIESEEEPNGWDFVKTNYKISLKNYLDNKNDNFYIIQKIH